MKKKLHLGLSSLFFLLLLTKVHAQDVHLSHLHASPLLLNPAMTGLYTGDLRFIGNTKSQWNGITKGYRTMVGTVDSKLWKVGRGDVIGGGLQVYSDVAGDLNFKTTSTSLYLSVLKALDNKGTHFISFGIQNTLFSNSFDYSKIIAHDDEPAVGMGEDSQRSYYDLTAGVAWFKGFGHDNSIHFGLSAAHLNKPDVMFFNNKRVQDNFTLFRKITFHGGMDLRLSKKSVLKPSFIFLDQGPHRQLTMGSFWKYKNLKKSSNTKGAAIYLGGWLRWHFEKEFVGTDAMIAAVRLDYDQMYITFSFDINISSLSEVSYGRGGPELSVVKILSFKRAKRKSSKVICPDF